MLKKHTPFFKEKKCRFLYLRNKNIVSTLSKLFNKVTKARNNFGEKMGCVGENLGVLFSITS